MIVYSVLWVWSNVDNWGKVKRSGVILGSADCDSTGVLYFQEDVHQSIPSL